MVLASRNLLMRYWDLNMSKEVTSTNTGEKVNLLGNVAIVRGALEAGVRFFSCYPGTPSSEVGDTFSQISNDLDIDFEYSVNEKIAVEIAFAASLAGARSMCSMKHLGLNYANDPISTMPYVGVEAGMVIVSAGDPSALTSPNEQDQRHFSKMLFYPMFDPATPEDAHKMTRFAFELSEKTRLPVIMRPTTRVCHSTGIVELEDLPQDNPKPVYKKNPERHVPIPVNARRMRKELTGRFDLARTLLADSGFFPRTGNARTGVIASGIGYTYASSIISKLELQDKVTLQQIGAYPIPEKVLAEFIQIVDRVLVVEELTAFVEEELQLQAFAEKKLITIYGKKSGHMPLEFEYSPEIVEDGIRELFELPKRIKLEKKFPDLPPRPPVLCAGCPHRSSYYLVKKVFRKNTTYCNDIGCYTLGYGKPLDVCDVLLCMGSSISQASGISRVTGKRAVAFIGDSTFFHSGMPALVNAVQANDQITLVVLDNDVTAMTGFQPSVNYCASNNNPGFSGFSIEKAIKGLGVKEVFSVDPNDEESTLTALRQARSGEGVNVVVCHSPCVIYERRTTPESARMAYTVDMDKCNACTVCVRALGCPAIIVEGENYSIDIDLCDGCDLCAKVCKQEAITQL